MCGIAGILRIDKRPVEEPVLRAMTDSLTHRGPDSSGLWLSEDKAVGLGHRRLAILDLSAAGHQPMHSASGRYVISYNGEVYNFQELRQELEAAGYSFQGGSDTEVLLAAFEAWGIAQALQRFNGMFALAIWDQKERTLSLARDRTGQKPLYLHKLPRSAGYLFASELRALTQFPQFEKRLDRAALALYLRYKYIPAPHCIYTGTRKLEPGTFVTIDQQGSERTQRYWSLPEAAETPFTGTYEEALTELEAHVSAATKRRLLADVPLGIFLSGGVDSSLVTALACQHAQTIKTFAIGFEDQRYNEAPHAALVAKHLGTQHHEHIVTASEALDVVPKLPEIYDEPFADSSQIPTYLVSQMARRSVTVALTGDGGDELFHGYTRYKQYQQLERLRRKLPRLVFPLLERTPRYLWPLLEKQLKQRAPEITYDRFLKLTQILQANNPAQLYHNIMLGGEDAARFMRRPPGLLPATLYEHNLWPAHIPQARRNSLNDALVYMADDIHVKGDRAAMSVSLETRSPLMDSQVLSLAAQLPIAMLTKGGQMKAPLRDLLDKYVPRTLIDRPKQGFSIPVHDWLRGPLKDYRNTMLAAPLVREMIDQAALNKLIKEHDSGARNWGHQLWTLMMLGAWGETYL